MKHRLLLLLLFAAFSLPYSCVHSSTKLLTDEEYAELTGAAGTGWKLIYYGDSIVLKSDDLYYFYSGVSLPPMSEEQLKEYAIESGRRDYYELTITFVQKWTREKIEDARKKNDELRIEQRGLQEKHGLGHLTRNKLNSFFPEAPEDEPKIKAYEEDYERIQSELIRIPEYNSTKYSLFVTDNREGFEVAWSEDSVPPDFDTIFVRN
jgi:hypothetical protein